MYANLYIVLQKIELRHGRRGKRDVAYVVFVFTLYLRDESF